MIDLATDSVIRSQWFQKFLSLIFGSVGDLIGKITDSTKVRVFIDAAKAAATFLAREVVKNYGSQLYDRVSQMILTGQVLGESSGCRGGRTALGFSNVDVTFPAPTINQSDIPEFNESGQPPASDEVIFQINGQTEPVEVARGQAVTLSWNVGVVAGQNPIVSIDKVGEGRIGPPLSVPTGQVSDIPFPLLSTKTNQIYRLEVKRSDGSDIVTPISREVLVGVPPPGGGGPDMNLVNFSVSPNVITTPPPAGVAVGWDITALPASAQVTSVTEGFATPYQRLETRVTQVFANTTFTISVEQDGITRTKEASVVFVSGGISGAFISSGFNVRE